uniref:Uncharacterized protein n=1 Tax=Anguilla anguilla TaxID=7936 RepID=A0A0E9WN47_ANGAN
MILNTFKQFTRTVSILPELLNLTLLLNTTYFQDTARPTCKNTTPLFFFS